MRLLPLLLITGCAAVPPGPTSDQRALRAELEARVPGEARRCLPAQSRSVAAVRILDERTVVYRVGGTLWRSETSCRSLDPSDTLVVEPFTGEVCEGDRLRAVSSGARIPGPTCIFGPFTPYRPR